MPIVLKCTNCGNGLPPPANADNKKGATVNCLNCKKSCDATAIMMKVLEAQNSK